MKRKAVHIVCARPPYPADCGNAIDTFEKIRALRQCGVAVHLHMNRCDGDPAALCECCESVETYDAGPQGSRPALVQQLGSSGIPVMLENFYNCGLVDKLIEAGKKVIIRVRDHEGYTDPEKKCSGGFMDLWAKKQSQPDPYVADKCTYACAFPRDAEFLSGQLGVSDTRVLPPFVAWSACESMTGSGNFCLYHADLSHPCNEKIAVMLLEEVFTKCRYPFVIAGKNPSKRVTKLAHLYAHTCLVANPGSREITELVQKAHINIVPSLHPGRIYKLLHSIFRGRHCITNPIAVEGTGLETACHIAADTESIIKLVERLMLVPFSAGEIELRKALLFPTYDNRENAERLKTLLFEPA